MIFEHVLHSLVKKAATIIREETNVEFQIQGCFEKKCYPNVLQYYSITIFQKQYYWNQCFYFKVFVQGGEGGKEERMLQ